MYSVVEVYRYRVARYSLQIYQGKEMPENHDPWNPWQFPLLPEFTACVYCLKPRLGEYRFPAQTWFAIVSNFQTFFFFKFWISKLKLKIKILLTFTLQPRLSCSHEHSRGFYGCVNIPESCDFRSQFDPLNIIC